ncbi:hypothetical protein [Azotobacter armeniacus]
MKNEGNFEWVEIPSSINHKVRPGTEASFCYGGSTCIAPPLKSMGGMSAEEFEAHLASSEALVKNSLRQKAA